MKFVYDNKQLKKAVKFLKKKNPYIMDPDNIETRIRIHLDQYAKEVAAKLKRKTDWSYSATSGYFLIATRDSDDEILIEILVDPAVGIHDDDGSYITFEV